VSCHDRRIEARPLRRRSRRRRMPGLRVAAGQTMRAVFESPHGSACFNLLPPDSPDAAMHVGQSGANRFEGFCLPTASARCASA
jgi:hypothetical protein